MAVGRNDTDRVFDKYIAPTLRAAKISPVFMGRLEHNDDIDKRIMREIEECDFAIADLTYARPSVYFEAGYAQRGVPVIYTSREDHLTPQADDKFGNLRVHFDLLMRNIIRWSAPNDSGFPVKLAKRISKVVAPLLRQRQSDERARTQELQFQNISLSSRLGIVYEVFIRSLKRSRYRPLVEDDKIHPWVGRVPGRQALRLGVISVAPTFTQNDIEWAAQNTIQMLQSRFESFSNNGYNRQRWQNQWHGHRLPNLRETRHVTRTAARLFLCSLEKVSRTRIVKALPSYATDQDGLMRLDTTIPIHTFENTKWLPVSLVVCVIDGIKSEADAVERTRGLRGTLTGES